MFKDCTKCGSNQSFESFSKDKYHPTGRKSVCKSCVKDNYESNKVEILARNQRYVRSTGYVKNRRKVDDSFRIAQNLRSRLSRMIKRNKAGVSAIKDLGCSLEQLKMQLEVKFQFGMTWENYGDWEIDHVIPLSSAKNSVDLMALCHYSNLQPLWKTQNRMKSNKVAA